MFTEWFIDIHPLYIPMPRIRVWLCQNLVERFAGETGVNPPAWTTEEFKNHTTEIFRW